MESMQIMYMSTFLGICNEKMKLENMEAKGQKTVIYEKTFKCHVLLTFQVQTTSGHENGKNQSGKYLTMSLSLEVY